MMLSSIKVKVLQGFTEKMWLNRVGFFTYIFSHPEKLPIFKKMEMLNLSFSLNIFTKLIYER